MVDISDIRHRRDKDIQRYVIDSEDKFQRWIKYKFEKQDADSPKIIDLSNCIIRTSPLQLGAYVTKLYNFEDAIISCDSSEYNQQVNYHFKCTNSVLYDAKLFGVIFKEDAIFSGSIFVGNTDMSNCIFEGRVLFDSVTFTDKCLDDDSQYPTGCHFDFSKFKNYTSFEKSIFKVFQVTFYNATFNELYSSFSFTGYGNNNSFISYYGSTFNSGIQFENVVCTKNINLGNCTFDGSVTFYDNTFEGDLSFAESIFNKHLYLGKEQIEGDANYTSIKRLILRKTRINWRADFEFCKIDILFGYFMDVQKDSIFRIFKSSINSVDLTSLCNRGIVVFEENSDKIEQLTLYSALNIGQIEILNTHIANLSDRRTAQILKDSAIKSSNKIDAIKYKSQEMVFYKQELKSAIFQKTKVCRLHKKRRPIEEYLLLFLNKWSNNNGQSWLWGVAFTLIVALFWYILIILSDIESYWFYSTSGEVWKNYLQVLNALNFRDNPLGFTLNALGETWFFISKIFISYGIYQTVSAFRKYRD
nr:pentapeptide repeat-containing protein [uncultured Bacteroides sp.]